MMQSLSAERAEESGEVDHGSPGGSPISTLGQRGYSTISHKVIASAITWTGHLPQSRFGTYDWLLHAR